MKKIILPLFCLILFNCNKSEAIANESVSAMAVMEDVAVDSAAVSYAPISSTASSDKQI